MKLNVSKRNQPNQKIDLGKDVIASDYSETIFLIGRSKDCHVVLDDKQISREHVRIIHQNGKWFAEKTSAENNCLHNGEDFQKIELENNDVLTITSFTITVENESQSQTYKPAPENIEVPLAPPPPVTVERKEKVKKEISTPQIKAIDADPTGIVEITADEDVEKEDDGFLEVGTSEDLNHGGIGNVTEDIDLSNDLDSFGESQLQTDDEFSSVENTENDAEMALGVSTEESLAVEEGHPLDENEEENSPSYSLENIDNSSDNESTRVIQSFAKVQLELFGETAPYDTYLLEEVKTFIGRDPAKCQIVLNDSEVSSVHAVIIKNNIMITLEDLNSSNGTILNGDRINKSTLNHGDEFVIGGVTFTVKFRSEFLKEEGASLMAVDNNQTVEVEEFVEVEAEEGEQVDALGEIVSDAPQEKSLIKRIWKDEQKRKKAIYAIVALVGAWVMFGDDSSNTAPVAKKTKKATVKTEEKVIVNKVTGKKISDEERRALSARYEIGKNHYYNGRYREALDEFQKIAAVDANFNSSLQSLIALSKEGLSKLEEQEKKRLTEQLAAEKKIKIKGLIEKATEYVKDRRVEMSQEVFNEIAKIDPENIEVSKMKMELEDWQKEKSRKELEAASKKKAREDRIEKLKPGKTYYLQKEWFKAIGKLEDFLQLKDMDEDLTKEASEMLKTSRDEINNSVAPLIGKAKSLLEGQDLKGAYEVYQQILKVEPSNVEALNQTVEIKDQLSNKARKIYREAIISESLSLFQDAKEKFQEVQQISPIDSDYYKKATEKLKDYLE